MHPTKGPFSCLAHSNGGCLQQAVVAGLATLPKRMLLRFLRNPKINKYQLQPTFIKKQNNVKPQNYKNSHFSKLKKNQLPNLTASSWSYKHQPVAHTDGVNELHHLNRSSNPFCALKKAVAFSCFPISAGRPGKYTILCFSALIVKLSVSWRFCSCAAEKNNPPALPACLVEWGLMTDCLSVLCFCLYSLS